jgi:hypothetical protein
MDGSAFADVAARQEKIPFIIDSQEYWIARLRGQ